MNRVAVETAFVQTSRTCTRDRLRRQPAVTILMLCAYTVNRLLAENGLRV